MGPIFMSILCIVVGVSAGALGTYLIINAKLENSTKKAEDIIENAKKEAEKNKRDTLFERNKRKERRT